MSKENNNIISITSRSRQQAERDEALGKTPSESVIFGAITYDELCDFARDGYGGAIGWNGQLPAGYN